MKIAIVGLGYVGLPLVASIRAGRGVAVIGLDIDPPKIEALNAGRSYIKHIPSEAIAEAVKAGKFSASTDFSLVKSVEAVIICVPTPLNKNREPDISLHHRDRQIHRAAFDEGDFGRAGIHHVSGHDRRGIARGAWKQVPG